MVNSFTLKEGELIKDVFKDVIMKFHWASSLIGGGNLSESKVNVFRLTQSLDDPTVIFWRPYRICEGEWPYIFFLKLMDGKLLPNNDLGASI